MFEEIKEMNMLKETYSSGFTVSADYSKLKMESRSTIEIPLSVNVVLRDTLKSLETMYHISKVTSDSFEAHIMNEQDLCKQLVPVYERMKEFTTTFAELKAEIPNFSELDKFFFKEWIFKFNYIKKIALRYEIAEYIEQNG